MTERKPRRTGVCLAGRSTGFRMSEFDPLKERTAGERRLSAKVRRRGDDSLLSEACMTERKPRRTGVCLAGRSTGFRMSEFDPLKERTVDERRLSAKVRRRGDDSLLSEACMTERKPRRTGVCLAGRSTGFRMSEFDPLKERTAGERRLSAKVRRQ
jgi:hypothetical protein